MSEFGDYWSSRVSRRRALRGAALGLSGLAGAALIGCGGDDDAPVATAAATTAAATTTAATATATTATGGAATATATAATAAPTAESMAGGTFKYFSAYDVDTFDNHESPSYKTFVINTYTHSRLVRYAVGQGSEPASGAVEGDLAETFEQPDDTTIIFNLRRGIPWDRRPPTNGRDLDSEDVIKSWDRVREGGAYRKVLANEVEPTAPIVSMEATDANTVVVKLARADALTLPIMAWYLSGFWILPKEAAGGSYDPAADVRGNGPFLLDSYTPSVEFKMVRNPDWWGGPQYPLFDAVELPIIEDVAQREAQFRAGNIYLNGPSGAAFPQIVSEVEGTELFTGPATTAGSSIGFNMIPESGFVDQRVRRAFSMTQDRDIFSQIFLSLEDYSAIGVELTPNWNTPMSSGFGPFYLDPQGPDFGPSAANLHHNIPEATKLLAAAGFDSGNPFKFDLIWPGTRYGSDWPAIAETLQSMALDAGIQINLVPLDYTTEWIVRTESDANGMRTGGGYFRAFTQFEGPTNVSAALMNPSGGRSTAGEWLSTFYTSAGPNNQVGNNWPQLDQMVTDARSTFDYEDQLDKYHEIQRYMMDEVCVSPFYPRAEGTGIKWAGLNGPGLTKAWGGGALGNGNQINELYPLWSLDASLRG